MSRRQVAGYVMLLAVLLGLTAPLAVLTAGRAGDTVAADRGPEIGRLAADAEAALHGRDVADTSMDEQDRALAQRLARYSNQTGDRALVVGAGGDIVARSDPGWEPDDPVLRAALDGGRAGQSARDAGPVWPWRTTPFVLAEPVFDGGRVVGAVAILSPVDSARAATWRWWLLLLAADVTAIVVAAAVLRRTVGWMLRPVVRLDRAARQWRLGGGTVEPVDIGPGPRELHDLAATFNGLAQRIDVLLTRQRTFASYASHQLRTPLAILRLSMETLRPPGDDDEAIADYEAVIAELDRMARLCESLLAYASAESVASDLTDVDVAELADARVGRWRPAAAQAKVTLERRGMAPVVARAAYEAVSQCIDIFVDNAIKYAGPGARIVVATYALPGHRVQVDVMDDGIGVAGDNLGRAAAAFWRDQAHVGLAGSGLGVTIADALVTASGGRLSMLAVHPHGLRVRILLPAGTLL